MYVRSPTLPKGTQVTVQIIVAARSLAGLAHSNKTIYKLGKNYNQ